MVLISTPARSKCTAVVCLTEWGLIRFVLSEGIRVAARTTAIRDFIEYVLAKDGVGFMRRVDIAEHWIKNFHPSLTKG